jgi:hypothetical protein
MSLFGTGMRSVSERRVIRAREGYGRERAGKAQSATGREGGERRTPVTLFTVQLELGPETRAMIERVAANAAMHLELGPKTRETIKALVPKDSKK